jgi:hypothetical protein
MTFLVSESAGQGSTFLVPEGTHLATCFAVIGVGRQETVYGLKERAYFGWEVHGQRFQWSKDDVEYDLPATVWRPYNVSMHKNSTLRIDIEAWRGHTLTTEEAKGFDLFSMVGVPCQLTLEHNAYGDRTYNNVKAVNQPLTGVTVPPMESEEIRYIRPAQVGDWALLPPFIQKVVENQVEPPPKGGAGIVSG